MKQNRILLIITILVCLLILAMFLVNYHNRQTIRLGYIAEMSGFHSEIGITGRDSAQLAVDKINAAGGIGGVPLELIPRDNKGIVGNTLKVVQELVEQEGVVAVISNANSQQTAEAVPYVNQKKIVMLSSATSVEFSKKKDYLFRVVPDCDITGIAFADYLNKNYPLSTYAGLFDTSDRSFTEAILKSMDKRLRAHGKNIDPILPFDANRDNLRLFAEKVASYQPKGVIIAAASVETALLVQHLHRLGLQAQYFGTVWAHTYQLIEKGGLAIQGMILITHNTTLEENPFYQDYDRRFKERYHHPPGLYSIHPYESVEILAQALLHTGGSAAGLPEALLSIQNFPGVLGDISFDAYGDVKRDLYIVRVDGNTFTNIKIISPNEINP